MPLPRGPVLGVAHHHSGGSGGQGGRPPPPPGDPPAGQGLPPHTAGTGGQWWHSVWLLQVTQVPVWHVNYSVFQPRHGHATPLLPAGLAITGNY